MSVCQFKVMEVSLVDLAHSKAVFGQEMRDETKLKFLQMRPVFFDFIYIQVMLCLLFRCFLEDGRTFPDTQRF